MSELQFNFDDINKELELTKEKILEKISEEEIYSHYGVPIKKGLFCSILRQDNHPTVSLYRNKSGHLMMKDFGNGWCGDCFSFVCEKFNCNFSQAIVIIANDFGLIKKSNLVKHDPKIIYDGTKINKNEVSEILVEIRPFQDYELKWWAQFGITEKTLKKFKVFSCKNIWLNGNFFHLETNNQKIFGYYGGSKKNIERWKIYFPGHRKYKFLSNWDSNMIQGAKQLSKDGGELLIIQKSMKDVMLLYEFGIQSIAPMSENTSLSEKVIEKLKSKFKRIIFWFDNDEAGLLNLDKIKEKHPELEYYSIPLEFGAKDFSDFYKAHGKKKSQELLNNLINGKKDNPERS